MIRAIRLVHFKCFRDQTIPIAPLTLLTGQNGMGKSSVVQSLLLLRQSTDEGMLPGRGLLLNGELVRLGTAQDVLYEGADADDIHVELTTEATTRLWRFSAKNRYDDVIPVLSEPSDPLASMPFGEEFRYLAAERIGPREVHESSDYRVERLREMGADGALGVAFLDAHADDAVIPALLHKNTPGRTLLAQVTGWLSEVSPGVRLVTNRHRDIHRATLSVSFTSGRASSRHFRPTGVGFGLSYTLPVITALLSAKPKTTIAIENPEAHLHPRGQMAIGELLARAASAGINVLVETHSDHVINGVRLAVKDGVVRPDEVAFHFFSRDTQDEYIVHHVISPRIDRDGRLDSWPAGFFDQWDIALERLL